MNQSFRSEVFKMCKKLQNDKTAVSIRAAIHSIKFTKENNGKIEKNAYGDFIQLAEHSSNQFHGYLFADDYADKIQLPAFFNVGHLTSAERELIETGHKTLTRFVELCIDDISKKSKIVADAISPYYLYKSVSISNGAKSIFEDNEFDNLVKAFKNGKVYKALYESDIAKFFNIMNVNQMQTLMGITNKEFSTGFTDDVPSDIRTLSIKLMNNQMDAPDAL